MIAGRGEDSAEVEWLWEASNTIALSLGALEIAPLHVLLAIMMNESHPAARIINAYGAGTYHSLRKRKEWERLPPPWSTPQSSQDKELPISLAAHIRRTIAGWRVRIARFLRKRKNNPEVRQLPLSAGAKDVLLSSERLALGAPGVLHHLIAIASLPGRHQAILLDSRQAVAAAGRKGVGLLRSRDRITLRVASVGVVKRRLASRVFTRPSFSPSGVLMAASAFVWGFAVFTMTALRFAIIYPAIAFFYFVTFPAACLVSGIRNCLAVALGLQAGTAHLIDIPGGEGIVSDPRERFGHRSAIGLLAPRGAAFIIGVGLFVPFLLRSWRIGQPIDSVLATDPSLITNGLLAPVMIVGDAIDGYGLFGGLALITSIGCLMLSMPTASEMDHVRLALGLDVRPKFGLSGALLWPISMAAHVTEGLDSLFAWANGPLYLTARLASLIGGLVLAILIAQGLPV
jgi:hypothetical protein